MRHRLPVGMALGLPAAGFRRRQYFLVRTLPGLGLLVREPDMAAEAGLKSGDLDRLVKLIRSIEHSPRRMTLDGYAYKALIPASEIAMLERVADQLETSK